MMEGLLVWMPAMDSSSPSLWKDCLTVREANESLVTKKSGQVSLTQLNPVDTIRLAITSIGSLLSPSATIGSRCDTQFTHANFTRCPFSSTIQREFVERGRDMAGLASWMIMWKTMNRGRIDKEVNLPMLLAFSLTLRGFNLRRRRTWTSYLYIYPCQ